MTPTPVAIYARHSMDRQQHSTQDQIERCKKYCIQKNYEVTCIFYDEEISGAAIINRPGIGDLIEASLCGYFEKVVSEDLSRFSRDQGDISYLFKKMRFLDIALHTVTEGEINELHIGLKGTMNALYLKDLGDKTHRGMIAAVLRGSVPGGRAYGYDTVHQTDDRGEPIRGLRKINEQEAEVVRFIFKRYDEGMALKNISDALNLKGIPSPKGGKWVPTTLIGQVARKTGLLRQSLYKGVVTFNRMAYRKHPDTGKRLSFLRPEKDWLKIPIPELALFTDDYFDGIQEKIEDRSNLRKQRILLNEVLDKDEKAAHEAYMEKRRRQKQAKVRKQATYIVSGRLICADHDKLMKSGGVKLYNCPKRKCQNRNLRLERDLLPPLLADLYRFDGAGLDDFFTTGESERQRFQDEKDEWNQKLETCRKEIQDVLDLFGKDRKTAETKSWLENRALKIQRFQFEIDKLSKELIILTPTTKAEKESIVMAFQRAVKTITNAYHNDTFDQLATSTVHAWVKNFYISSTWNEDENKWKLHVETRYNWPRLIQSLRS